MCGVELRDGTTVTADWYVGAVPFDRLLDLLPAERRSTTEPYFRNLRHLETVADHQCASLVRPAGDATCRTWC